MEVFVAGQHNNISLTVGKNHTIPVQLGRDPVITQLLAQSELQETVIDLGND